MLRFNIDGVAYEVDSLTPHGQAQLRSLQYVDQQLQKIRAEIEVYETSRAVYMAALKAEAERAVAEGGTAG